MNDPSALRIFLLVLLVTVSCKNQSTLRVDSSVSKQTSDSNLPGATTGHDQNSFRANLLSMQESIDTFLIGQKPNLKNSGMVILNDSNRADAVSRYLDSLELYKVVFSKEYFLENHYRAPNIYDRYVLGSQAALDSMVAILDTAKTDGVNAMLKEIEESAFLHEAKWTYPNPFVEIDTNLISSEILVDKIIPYLKTKETEFAAARLVMMLKNREDILGEHLFSQECHRPDFILRDLLQFTQSNKALEYLELNMGNLDSLGIRKFHVEDPLNAYIKNATDPKLKSKAIVLGGEFLLSYSIRENTSDLPNIRLVNSILEFEGKEVLPFLRELKENNVKDPRIELKLWELNEGMSDEELIDYLSAGEANLTPNGSDWYDFMDYRVYMLKHDADKSLRNLNDKFYHFLFKDVLEATFIGAMGWWANNLHKVVYHFNDLNGEAFTALMRPVLDYEMSRNTYYVESKIEERMNEMSRLHELSRESVKEVLGVFLEKGFIGQKEYQMAAKKARVDDLEDTFGRSFYAALNAINPRRIHLIGGKFELFPHRIKESEVTPLSDYPIYEYYGDSDEKTSISEKVELMVFVAGGSIYIMSTEHYRADEYCACDQMMHFLNEILIDQGYTEQLTKYYGGICEVCSFMAGDPTPTDQIISRYQAALKR